MSDAITFFVPGVPVGQGSKTRMRYALVDDNRARLQPWRADVTAAAITAMGGQPPMGGPCSVKIIASFCRPRSHYGTGRNSEVLKPSAPIYHTQTPDADKVARAILDALTVAKVWLDDRQAFRVYASRRWVERWDVGGAWVHVSERGTGPG